MTHITKTTRRDADGSEIDSNYTFCYKAIESALIALGASDAEADALTEILHVEGWGGIEETESRDFTNDELSNMLAWLREHRPVA